jgi:hypothetical protein
MVFFFGGGGGGGGWGREGLWGFKELEKIGHWKRRVKQRIGEWGELNF